jgi:hypothetical protein
MSVWFVSPAWGRFEMTAICLEQRQRVIATLAEHGIEAHQVVIANDDNLDIARGLGAHVIERNNDWLGRKFNDGYQFAGEHGAEWIVPIGSDSWIDPAYFLPLPSPKTTRTSGRYAPVEAGRLAELFVGRGGAGPHTYHRSMFPSGFRAAPEKIRSRIDSNTITGMVRRPKWAWQDLHPLQYVGFRAPPFITSYDKLVRRWGVTERRDPWPLLAQHYPADLVERARVLMNRP